jgi:aspartate carbamoyltransferase catalytic subunit
MKHLITTNDLTIEEIKSIFESAKQFDTKEKIKKSLKNKTIVNLFFENSTRTRSSFEIASKRLGANILNLDISKSSTNKGESLLDTAFNLDAIGADALIVRHSHAGVPHILKKYLKHKSSIVNAGDGSYAHPTQALLDLYTLSNYFSDFKNKKIAIVGDIKNSRVANSNISLMSRFGIEVILVAPPHFLPKTDLRTTYFLDEIIDEVDAIMSLRTQTERHSQQSYGSLSDYSKDFCITQNLIKEKEILLLHPGPVHRNIDIEDSLLNDSRSKVLEQVNNGVLVRMAVLQHLLTKNYIS